MALKWQGLVQEKLFLAQTLLKKAAQTPTMAAEAGEALSRDAGLKIGLIQGAVALTLQARESLLVLVAQLNQSKAVDIASLDALAGELGEENADVARLIELSRAKGSWWRQLDSLQQWMRQPRTVARRPDGDNLIAVDRDSGDPDLSPQSLLDLNKEIKHYVSELCQWHGEW